MSIKVDLKIFLFALLFFITRQVKIYAILMIFAFIHEIGHLIMGIILGFKPQKIGINPFGVQIEFDILKSIEERKHISLKKIFLYLAGPITNFIIVLICIALNKKNLDIIIYANILLGIFNLLPIYPLDGGRILLETLNIIFGIKKSYTYINIISNIIIIALTAISSILILYIKNVAIIFILIYLWYLVIVENKRYKLKKRMYEVIEKNCINI